MRRALTALLLAPALLVALPAHAAWAPGGIPLCTATGNQYASDAVSDGAGGVVVVFSDGVIFAQRVTFDGATGSGWPGDGSAVSHSAGSCINAHAAADGHGGAIVVWEDSRTDVADLYAQHVLGSGVIDPAWPPVDLPIAVGPFNQYTNAVASDGVGGALVVWQDDRNGAVDPHLDIYAQRIGPGGTTLWTANGVPVCIATGDQWLPKVAADGLGGAYLAWVDQRGSVRRVYAQHLTASGDLAPGWPADGIPVGSAGAVGAQRDVALAPDGEGGVLIAWSGSKNQAVYHTFVLRLGPSGAVAPGWPALGTQLCDVLQTQDQPQVVSDRAGGAIVAWQDFRDISNPMVSYHIYAQRVNAAGARQWALNGVPVCTAPGSQGPPVAVSDHVGGVIVAWQDGRAGSDGADIYALRLTTAGVPAPGWDPDGTALCTQPGGQSSPVIVADGLSGAVVAWTDSRPAPRFQAPDIYAAKTLDDVPVPVLASLVSATAEPDRVRIAWWVPSAGMAVHVWRRIAGGLWSQDEALISAGDGSLAFEDRAVEPGTTYDYRLGLGADGSEPFAGEARLTVPGSPAFALEGAEPNPAADGLTLAFSLPDDAPASLEVLDVTGRVRVARSVAHLGAGRHVVRVAEAGALPPGVYYIRLTRAGRALTTRAALVR